MARTETQRITTQEVRDIVLGDKLKKGHSPLGLWEDDERFGAEGLMRRLFLTTGDLNIEPIVPASGKSKAENPKSSTLRVSPKSSSHKTTEAEPPKSLADFLDLDDTTEVDMIAELDAASPLNFADSAKPAQTGKNTTPTAEWTYINPRNDNPFPRPGIKEFEDFLFGLPELADPERAERDITNEDTQEIPIVKIVDDPDDPARETLSMLDLSPRWMDDLDSSESNEENTSALRNRLFERLTSTLTSLQDRLKPEPVLESNNSVIGHPDEMEVVNIDAPLSIADLTDKVFPIIKKIILQANDKIQPILAEGVELAFAMDEPVAMTEEELQRDKLRLAGQAAALFVAISLLSQENLLRNNYQERKTSLLNPSTGPVIKAESTIDLVDLAARVKAVLALAPHSTIDQIAGQVIAAPKHETGAPFMQKRGEIVYPKNLIKNALEYVQLPEDEMLYRFFSLQDYGEFGYGQGETCPAQRFGHPDLIGVIHTTALAWHAAHPDLRLMIADLNADGHASHTKGIDFDVYMEDDTIRWNSPGYKVDRAIELGKMMLETDRVKLMFFNDPDVIVALNNHARENGLSGTVEYAKNHDAHFHVRITAEPGPESAPSCEEAPSEPEISIKWLPEDVMRWAPQIIKYSKESNVDPNLFAIILYKENRGKAFPDSPTGAIGPAYVQPDTGKEIAAELGITSYDLRDPATNIRFGMHYLGKQLREFGDPTDGPDWNKTVLKAAMAYNGGPGAVEGYLKGEVISNKGPYCESREYAHWVLGMYQERHDRRSRTMEEYDRVGHRCASDANSYPISALKQKAR